MATAGSELQRVRRERKLSLSDVTKATKIQPWVLEALEADRLQEMMSPVYVKGFLATYARLLRLDPDAMVTQVPWTKAAPEPAEPPQAATPPIPVVVQWRWPRINRRWVAAVASTAALVALVAANPLRHVTLRWPRATQPHAAKKPAAAPAPVAALASVVAPIAEPLSAPQPPPSVARSQPLELAVSAQRTTWIRVRADGKLLIQQRLQRGAKERWVAKKQLEVIIANPSQVDVQLNGEPISSFAIAHQGRLMITHHGITRLPDDAS